MSARSCHAYADRADYSAQRRAYDVWFAAYKARVAAGDAPVAAIAHAYRIELLFWVLTDVAGRRTT